MAFSMELSKVLQGYDIENFVGVLPTTALDLRHKETGERKRIYIKEESTLSMKNGKMRHVRTWKLDEEKEKLRREERERELRIWLSKRLRESESGVFFRVDESYFKNEDSASFHES